MSAGNRTKIIVGVLALIGVLSTAVISNWEKLKGGTKEVPQNTVSPQPAQIAIHRASQSNHVDGSVQISGSNNVVNLAQQLSSPTKKTPRKDSLGNASAGATRLIEDDSSDHCVGSPDQLRACYERWGIDPNNLPFSPNGNPGSYIQRAFAKAKNEGKVLMIEFGANWCPDCLVLYNLLTESKAKEYFERNFVLVTVDLGADYTQNLDIAQKVGVDLSKGIPAAVFYEPDGSLIGNTNNKELEPSRKYSSTQILAFLKKIVTERRIVRPDKFIQLR